MLRLPESAPGQEYYEAISPLLSVALASSDQWDLCLTDTKVRYGVRSSGICVDSPFSVTRVAIVLAVSMGLVVMVASSLAHPPHPTPSVLVTTSL